MSGVGIVGAGAVACATAAWLHGAGSRVTLWSPSGAGTAALDPGDDGVARAPLAATGALEVRAHPSVARSAAELAGGCDVLLLALPAYGHRATLDALAPHVGSHHTVVFSSHASFGVLYLSRLLAARGVEVPLVAWGTTLVTARLAPPTSPSTSPSADASGDASDGAGVRVTVNTVRARIDVATVPERLAAEGAARCRALFGDRFVERDGLLAIALSNLNPQNHMGIALGNMTRMELGETWSQGRHVTPNVGRLLEALDAERLAIADALGLEVRTIFEHFHLSFHVPLGSVSDMNRRMHDEGRGGTGPATADSRYVTEDVPYGLLPTVLLGELCGRPAALHAAGIDLFSAMYGRNFRAENTLLPPLGIDAMGLDDLRALVRFGYTGDIEDPQEHATT